MKSSWEMQTEYGERKTWGEYRKEFLKKKGKFELEHEMIGTDFLGKMDGNFVVPDDTEKQSEMGAFYS